MQKTIGEREADADKIAAVIGRYCGNASTAMNLFKSLFTKSSDPIDESSISATDRFERSEHSPRYAYAFESPFKRPRILILVDDVRATYFLFFHYVLARLHKTESLAFFVLDSAEVARWTKARSPEAFVSQVIEDMQPTLVIFSRYGLPHGGELLRLFKQQGVSTVCHIDDDLLNITAELGEDIQKRQGNEAMQKARRSLLEESDLIYASTAFLGDRLTAQFPQQSVFSSRCTPYLNFLLKEPNPPKAQPFTIGYMGSKGHQADLSMVASPLQQLMKDFPDLRFETFGTIAMPEELKEFGDRICAHKTNISYASFLNQLQQLNWDIGLAPLKDTPFNRCKTPVKYIEYTACGIPVVASGGNVYSQFTSQEHIVISGPNEWADKIRQLIENDSLRQSLVTNGQAYCAQKFNLDALETQIKELLVLI